MEYLSEDIVHISVSNKELKKGPHGNEAKWRENDVELLFLTDNEHVQVRIYIFVVITIRTNYFPPLLSGRTDTKEHTHARTRTQTRTHTPNASNPLISDYIKLWYLKNSKINIQFCHGYRWPCAYHRTPFKPITISNTHKKCDRYTYQLISSGELFFFFFLFSIKFFWGAGRGWLVQHWSSPQEPIDNINTIFTTTNVNSTNYANQRVLYFFQPKKKSLLHFVCII